MASKKQWKERAKQQERIADDLFVQVNNLSGQLHAVDTLLMEAEFPGPTIDAWCAQMQQFLNRLVEVRGVIKKSSLGGQSDTQTAPSTSEQRSASSPSRISDDGTYTMLTDKDLEPFPQEVHDIIHGPSTQVPAGPDRFA